jgi:hypothetical protein
MHIADIDFAEFYAPAFPSLAEAKTFYASVKSLDGPAPAKIAVHQGARMLWLADRMDDVARGRSALQILFYLIAAEAVAKILYGFKGEGQSKKHVMVFFGDICSEKHRNLLSRAFSQTRSGFLTWERAVEILYDARCDVVHEGRYFEFNLRPPGSTFPELVALPPWDLEAHISSPDLRQVVLEGVVEGVQRLLRPTS